MVQEKARGWGVASFCFPGVGGGGGGGGIDRQVRTKRQIPVVCPGGGGGVVTLRHRLQEPGFICNRIVFDAVTPSVYTTPIETFGETGLI